MLNAEVLALLIAGIVAAPFIQFVKERLKWVDWKAMWLTWGLCIVVALAAQLVTGELQIPMLWQDPPAFLTDLGVAFAAVFGLATVIFKAKFSQPGRPRAPPE